MAACGCLADPNRWREQIYRGLLANDIIGFHLPSYVHNFLDCCRELLGFEVDYPAMSSATGPRDWSRAYPLGSTPTGCAASPRPKEVADYERELLSAAAST